MKRGHDADTVTEGMWLPNAAALRAACARAAAVDGSAPADASLLVRAAWLVSAHAGIWCSSKVAAALICPDSPPRGEDVLEDGRRRARMLAGMPWAQRDAELARQPGPAPMPYWLNFGPRARVRYDLAEVVAVAAPGQGLDVPTVRAQRVLDALRAAAQAAAREKADAAQAAGIDPRVVQHVLHSAGLALPQFMRLCAGPAWMAWAHGMQPDRAWPFVHPPGADVVSVFAAAPDASTWLAAMASGEVVWWSLRTWLIHVAGDDQPAG